jgi:hypothetical protein
VEAVFPARSTHWLSCGLQFVESEGVPLKETFPIRSKRLRPAPFPQAYLPKLHSYEVCAPLASRTHVGSANTSTPLFCISNGTSVWGCPPIRGEHSPSLALQPGSKGRPASVPACPETLAHLERSTPLSVSIWSVCALSGYLSSSWVQNFLFCLSNRTTVSYGFQKCFRQVTWGAHGQASCERVPGQPRAIVGRPFSRTD